MNKIILVTSCFLIFFIETSSIKKELFTCPFKNGILIKQNIDSITRNKVINPRRSVEITGSADRVFSISTGDVEKVIKNDNTFLVAVRSSRYTIIYENLDSAYISEKQKITMGKLIGVSNSKKIELTIAKDGIQLMNPEKLLDCKCKNK